jgi:hypothetical protein
MNTYMLAVRDRVAALLKKKFGPLVVVGVVSAAAVFIAEAFFEDWAKDVAYPAIRDAWVFLTSQRLGTGGLLLIGWLAVLMGLAFIDTSPTVAWFRERRAPLTIPPALKPEEKFEVEFLRSVWLQHGHEATRMSMLLLEEIARDRSGDNPYVPLLIEIRNQLHAQTEAFNVAVDAGSAPTFADRLGTLEKTLKAYLRAVAWINQALADFPEHEKASAYKVHAWRDEHTAFSRTIDSQLAGRSMYRGCKLIFDANSHKILPPSQR